MKTLIFLALFFGISYASGTPDTPCIYIVSTNPIIKPPEKADIQMRRFADHLGLIESRGDWKIINPKGYMGKYQFGTATLEYLGYHGITPEAFKANPAIFPPAMQEQALKDLIRCNEKVLNKYKHYIGTFINGIRITKAGLIGAAHLAGAGGVVKYLTSNHNATDCNGASIQSYLQEFSNYNI